MNVISVIRDNYVMKESMYIDNMLEVLGHTKYLVKHLDTGANRVLSVFLVDFHKTFV